MNEVQVHLDREWNMKRKVLGISAGISFLLFLLLFAISNRMVNSLDTQTIVKRWSEDGGNAHVSCFFSVNSGVSQDRIEELEHSYDSLLADAGILPDPEKPGARLWVDAYSADGKITISSDRATLSMDAIGIGGDFFLFHPLKLLSGSYFSGNDVMQDYCVIDQDAAWQLFGSNDVAGQMVSISGVPHMITGVVQREDGRLDKAAGLDATLVYVSMESLTKYGRSNGINHYEVLMREPVDDFTVNCIKEKLAYDEKEIELVENSKRFSFLSRLKLIPKFGTRSMNGKAIIYPYWENVARGYEDILLVITLFEVIFLVFPLGVVIGLFAFYWKHKGWTLGEKLRRLKDIAERRIEKLRLRVRRKKKAQR